MDAMSDAIEGADVMLYGVSLRYKESANVSQRRLSSLAESSHSLLTNSPFLPRICLCNQLHLTV
jgi:hypothetical protein